MIQLLTYEDIKKILADYEKLNERTKIHTKQIKELQEKLK